MIERISVREFFTRTKSGRYVFPSIMEDIPLRGNEKELRIVDDAGGSSLLETVYVANAIDGVSIVVNGAERAKQLLEDNGYHL